MATRADRLRQLLSALSNETLSDEVQKILTEVQSSDPKLSAKNQKYNDELKTLMEANEVEDAAIKTLKTATASMDEKAKAYETLHESFDKVYQTIGEPRLKSLLVHLLLLDSEGFIRAKQGSDSIDKARVELSELDEKGHAHQISEGDYIEGIDLIKNKINTRYVPRSVLSTMGRDALPVGVNSLVTHQGRMYFVTGISRDKKCPEYGAKLDLYDPVLRTRRHVPHSYDRQHVTRARVFYDADGDVACEATGNVNGSYTWDTGCEALGFNDRQECEDAVLPYGHPNGHPKIALCRALLDNGLVYTRP